MLCLKPLRLAVQLPENLAVTRTAMRFISEQRLTKSITLISNSPKSIFKSGRKKDRFRLEGLSAQKVPLCIIMGWLMSKGKHVQKYAKLYLEQDFDVLYVQSHPWLMAIPVTGAKMISNDILSFCGANQHQYGLTVVHGFSVGQYIWSQLLVHMAEEPEKYAYMHDMVKGQIWDSMLEPSGLVQGGANALFPNNDTLRNAMVSCLNFYLHTFQRSALEHYKKTTLAFENSLIRTPALFFGAENDPVAKMETILKVAETWRANGCPVKVKSWGKSIHVSHMGLHPAEYKAEMKLFLGSIGALKYPDKFG